MKVGFLITARLKSTRLPKKLTLKVIDKEIIVWMIKRIKLCTVLDEIIIATSVNPQDDLLCEIAKNEDIRCFRGDEDDVLDRLYQAALEFELDYIINITADCPLVAFDFIEDVIDEFNKTNADLITSYKLPHGFFIYGIKISAMKKVIELKKDSNTEVWGAYFTDSGLFNVVDLEIPKEYVRTDYRLTLDYPEDYEFFKKVYESLGEDTYKKSSEQIIQFLDEHPEITKINKHCEEMYKKRWKSQKKVLTE